MDLLLIGLIAAVVGYALGTVDWPAVKVWLQSKRK